MLEREQESWSSIAQVGAEYETIAAVAQRDRWVALLKDCGLTEDQVALVLASDSFGPLTAELRRAEAHHHGVDALVPKLVAGRSLRDADDIGAVLISRLHHETSRATRGKRKVEPNLIAGLIPIADGPMAEEMAIALAERRTLIESRALTLAQAALDMNEPWLSRLGQPLLLSQHALDRWLSEVSTVAAYRDRYRIDSMSALGDQPQTDAQKVDAALARRAIRGARAVAGREPDRSGRAQAVMAEALAIR